MATPPDIGRGTIILSASLPMLAMVATLMPKAAVVSRFFHRVSLGIYVCWMVSFFSGAIAGIRTLR